MRTYEKIVSFKVLFTLFVLCLLLLAKDCFAQNARFDGVVQARSGFPAPGAKIAVCTQPCTVPANVSISNLPSPLASLCSSASDVACISPNPITADGLGNYNGYVVPGKYTVVFFGSGLTARTQVDQIFPCDPSNCSLSSVTLSGNLLVGGALGVTGAATFKTISQTRVASQWCSVAGVHNETCINNAIANAPSGGAVLVDYQSDWVLGSAGSGTELILINKPILLDCQGWSNTMKVAAAVPATTDVIHIFEGAAMEGTVIRNCQFLPVSGTPARNALNIDTTNFSISKLLVDHNYFGNFGGKGIVSINPTPLTDGFFTSWITHNVIMNGINLQNAGDNVKIVDNVSFGGGIGIDATFVTGAQDFIYEANNTTNLVACVHLGNASHYSKIIYNQCEGSVSTTGSNSAYVDVDGTVGNPAQHTLIYGNVISPVATNIDAVRINFATQTEIENNSISRAGGTGVDVRTTANTQAGSTFIGLNYWSPTSDTQTQILADVASSLVFWNFPYSQTAQGGTGSGLQIMRPLAVPNMFLVGTSGFISGTLSSAPSGAAGSDKLWPSSANNRWQMNNNNGGATTVAGFTDNLGVFASGGTITPALFASSTNCAAVGTGASPSVASCGAAPAGHFSCATNATGATCQVNTTAVTANSEIFVFESDTAVTGTALGVTCNTSTNVLPASRLLASSVAATSFTINLGTVTTNPACFSYFIVN